MDVIILWSIPVFLVSIATELAYAHGVLKLPVYEWKDSLACLAMGLGNVIIAGAFKLVTLGAFFFAYQFRLFTIPVDTWWAWVAIFFAEDFCYYWFHRVHHEVRLFWAAHVNHHSSERYNLAVALRQSWTTPFTGFMFWMPLALLGFHPLMIMTQQAISLLYQFWIHTQAIGRLGPLESVLNTPSHHRVHHGSNPQYLDRNYAGILIIWDKLFGSFEPEGEKVAYGLTKNIHTFNPLQIAVHEFVAIWRDFRAVHGWRRKLRAIFASPASLAENPL
jgi:sterol desaturase/sphingolipid hydroxylase (fatty acid hydroxylase superfamily)